MRSQSGSLIIESMVAMLIGSLMAIAIVSLLAQSLRIGTATSNQMVADQIANAVFETLRQYNFATIQSFVGGPIVLNINTGPTTASGPEPVLLGLDNTAFQWTPPSVSNSFPGSATLQVSQGATANTELVTVVVQWQDSSKNQNHTSTYSTVISGGGEDYWY